MKCDMQLPKKLEIEILVKNILGSITFLLKGFTIQTFKN